MYKVEITDTFGKGTNQSEEYEINEIWELEELVMASAEQMPNFTLDKNQNPIKAPFYLKIEVTKI